MLLLVLQRLNKKKTIAKLLYKQHSEKNVNGDSQFYKHVLIRTIFKFNA